MNEEALSQRGKAWKVWSERVDGAYGRDSGPKRDWHAGWDAARTFSAEDVERVAEVFIRLLHPKALVVVTPEARRSARSILAAIGTVEEAQ